MFSDGSKTLLRKKYEEFVDLQVCLLLWQVFVFVFRVLA